MKTEYIKTVKQKVYCYYYHYVYDHTEDRNIKHIKNPNKNEWYRYNSKERHVYYEDVSKREKIILHPELVKKAGRPVGSKDSYKRIRSKKED